MYHNNTDELESGLDALITAYPITCKGISLPYSTFEGRTVKAIRLGADGDRLAVLFWGGIHAREWMPPEICLSFAADLLEAFEDNTGLSYGSVSYSSTQVRQIMETYHLYFVPISNPDGHDFSKNNDSIGGTSGWRRNRNPSDSGGNPSCIGVDLNRNFDFLWDFQRHLSSSANTRNISDDPCSIVYHGFSPNSEQESKNLIWVLDTYPNIRWFFDIHSYSELILYSWGDDNSQTTNPEQNFINVAFDGVRGINGDIAYAEYTDATDLNVQINIAEEIKQGIEAFRGRNYTPSESFGLYPTTGTTTDYVASRHIVDPTKAKVYGLTLETGREFRPVWSEVEEVIREISSGLMRFLDKAPCITWPITVTPPANLEIKFTDIPEGLTTYRAIVFEVRGCGSAQVRIISGPSVTSGPAGTVLGTPRGVTASADPSPNFETPDYARIWVSYTGTNDGDVAEGLVRVRNDETDEEWDILIYANTVSRPTAAIALALDQSGSMDSPAGDLGILRIEALREAAARFVELIPAGNNVGFVRFDHDAYSGHPMTHIATNDMADTGRGNLRSAIMSHSTNPSGFTSIGDGVARARDLLDPINGYNEKAIIVFTDGIENRDQRIADVMGAIDERTFAIGLGTESQVSTAGLMALAGVRDGYLLLTDHLTSDTDDYFRLTKYFHQILAGVTRTDIVRDPSGEIGTNSKHRIPFVLNEADIEASVILLADQPQLNFWIESPNGDILDPNVAHSLGATFNVGTNMWYYRFGLPLSIGSTRALEGTWHAVIEVNRIDISLKDDVGFDNANDSKLIRYNLSIHTYSNLNMTARVDQNSLELGAKLNFSTILREYDIAFEGQADVIAEIIRPDGNEIIIPLLKTEFGYFEGEMVTSLLGVYRILFRAEGKTRKGRPFTREQLATASVFRGGNNPLPSGDYSDNKFCHLILCVQVFCKQLIKNISCIFGKKNS